MRWVLLIVAKVLFLATCLLHGGPASRTRTRGFASSHAAAHAAVTAPPVCGPRAPNGPSGGGAPWGPALLLGTGVTNTCPAITLLPPSRTVGRHPERPHLELRESPLLLCPLLVQKALGDLEGQRPQCPLLNVRNMPPTLAGPECTGPGLVPGGGRHVGLGTVRAGRAEVLGGPPGGCSRRACSWGPCLSHSARSRI